MLSNPEVIKISNTVATCSFSMPIDLEKLAAITSGDLNPAAFAAIQIRLLRPACTALVFHSGRLVTTGAVSESAALQSIYIFFRMIRQLNKDIRICKIDIQNIVASASLGKCVLLDKMVKAFPLDAIYDSSLFPGLRLKIRNPNVKVLVFVQGKVVITGAKTRDQLSAAWATMRALSAPFLTDDAVTHTSMQIHRNATRKRVFAL